MEKEFDSEKISQHWFLQSENDALTMDLLFENKNFHWSLFIGHIVVEKLLKSVYVKVNKSHAPFTHDLSKIASKTNLEFSEEYLDWLDTITTFNLNTRYDDYKQEFYKKCTFDYSKNWLEKIQILREWIKTKL